MANLFLVSLFHASFAPLWISILIKDYFSWQEELSDKRIIFISAIIIVVLFLFSLIIIWLTLSTKDKDIFTTYEILSAEEENSLTSEFLLSYILPLFTFDFGTKEGLILFAVFYLTIGFLCYRHNAFTTSIVLELLGYRFYTCELKEELENVVIKKKVVSNKNLSMYILKNVQLCSINDEYEFEKDIKKLK